MVAWPFEFTPCLYCNGPVEDSEHPEHGIDHYLCSDQCEYYLRLELGIPDEATFAAVCSPLHKHSAKGRWVFDQYAGVLIRRRRAPDNTQWLYCMSDVPFHDPARSLLPLPVGNFKGTWEPIGSQEELGQASDLLYPWLQRVIIEGSSAYLEFRRQRWGELTWAIRGLDDDSAMRDAQLAVAEYRNGAYPALGGRPELTDADANADFRELIEAYITVDTPGRLKPPSQLDVRAVLPWSHGKLTGFLGRFAVDPGAERTSWRRVREVALEYRKTGKLPEVFRTKMD
jgi:hypothetical protein